MRNRFWNALAIQDGACNVRGIARALVEAADEASESGVQPSEDPAVRLIVHQLAFLCATEEVDHTLECYGDLRSACIRGSQPAWREENAA